MYITTFLGKYFLNMLCRKILSWRCGIYA